MGAFRLRAGEDSVTATVAESAASAAVLDAFYGTVLPLLVQAVRGLEIVHASAVLARPGRRVVAFCGPSGVGKSTIAHGLAALGHTQWADDALAFRIDGANAITAVALPFMPKLRPPSDAYFGTSLTATVVNRPEPQTARLAGVFLLGRADSAGAVPSIARLDPPEALAALLPNAYRFQPQSSEHKRSTLRAYLDLVGTVPVFRTRVPGDLHRLPELLDGLDDALRSPA